MSIVGSKEWWLEKTNAEGDTVISAGAPEPPRTKPCHVGASPCPYCATSLPSQPLYYPTPAPLRSMGCICPPGANKECEAPMCPRKNYLAQAIGVTK
jgi:hypothetical protein